MGRLVRTLAITAIVFAVAGPALAGQTLTVELNHSRRIMIHGVAANVIVGNPLIADVNIIDGHSVVVMGRGDGETDLLVTDHAGHVLLQSDVVVAPSGAMTLQSGLKALDYSCSPRCIAVEPSKDSP
jgi:Flp pilus assembly secretin CpaC